MVPDSRCFSFDTKEAGRLISPVAQLRLTKAVDPSILPATRLLPATQEIPQKSRSATNNPKTPGANNEIRAVVTLSRGWQSALLCRLLPNKQTHQIRNFASGFRGHRETC
jgi:hypothetical protein